MRKIQADSFLLDEVLEGQAEPWEKGRSEGIRSSQRLDQRESPLLPTIDLGGGPLRINDPILSDAVPGIELEFDGLVRIRRRGGKNLYNQVRSALDVFFR
jgi:hypothetical protein